MRLSISNIAWDPSEDDQVAALLRRYDIDAIDVAPSKYFTTTQPPPSLDVARIRQWWERQGFEIVGLQALLFGTSGLNVFGAPEVQENMLEHLARICKIGAELGAKRLVFGSPKNRDRGNASDAEAVAVATSFFRRLGDVAAALGVVVCLEPNPPRYGANFLTTGADTAAFVRQLAHGAVRMQFDTGAFAISGESLGPLLELARDVVAHIHISEPDLVPIGDGSCDHHQVASVLRAHLGEPLVTIEMLATKDEGHLAAIERAIQATILHYRDPATRSLSS